MSLVSTWVQAKDGLFYQNPVLEGPGWFVCFDDDDPPELVMTEALAKTKKPRDILLAAGVSYQFGIDGRAGTRDFGKAGLRPAVSFWFRLTGPIPLPKTFEKVSSAPIGQGAYYRFKSVKK